VSGDDDVARGNCRKAEIGLQWRHARGGARVVAW
jgi:hypothetical protein